LKKIPKVLKCICLSVVGLFLIAVAGFIWWWVPDYFLPPEQRVVQQFESHRAEYIRFVTLLRKDASATYVGSDGKVDIDGIHGRFVPEYRDLIRRIGAKFVTVREDGSMEFALWGDGGTIISGSYMGVRYFPEDHKVNSRPGWTQTLVASLDDTNLTQENGGVASGLYVVAIEPEWYVYRLEIKE
jgi:hypothetical protein